MSRKRNILQLVTLATIGVGSALVINPQEALAADVNLNTWGTKVTDTNVGPKADQMRTREDLYQEVYIGSEGFDLIDVAGVPTLRVSGWAAIRGYDHHLLGNHAYGIVLANVMDSFDEHGYQAVETKQSATRDLLVEGFWANGVEITGYPTDGSTIHNSIWPNNTGIPDLITNGAKGVASNMYEAMPPLNNPRGNYIYDYVGYQVDIPASDLIHTSGTNYTYNMYLLVRFTDGHAVYNELNMNFDTWLTPSKYYNGGQFGLDSTWNSDYKINIDYVTPRNLDYSLAAPEDGWGVGHQFKAYQDFPIANRVWDSHWDANASYSLGRVMTRIGSTSSMDVFYHVDNLSWDLAQADHGYNMQNNSGIFAPLFYTSSATNITRLRYFNLQYTFNRGFYDYDSLVNAGSNVLIPNGTLPVGISAGGANPFGSVTLFSGQTEATDYTAPSTFRDTSNKEWVLRSTMPNGSDIVGDENQTGKAAVLGVGVINTSLKYYYERAKTPIKVRHVLVDYKLGQTTEQWTEKSVIQETTYSRFATDFNHTFNALPDDTTHTFLHAVDVDTNTSDGIIQSNGSIANTPVPTMSYTYNPITKDVEQTITFYYYKKDTTLPAPNITKNVSSTGTVTGYLNQYLYKDASMTSATDPTSSKYNVNGAVGGFENLFGVKNVSVTLEAGGNISVYADSTTDEYSFTSDFATLIESGGGLASTYIAPNMDALTPTQIQAVSTVYMKDNTSGKTIDALGINKPNLSSGTATSLDLTNDTLQKIKDGTITDDIKLTATYTVPTKIKHNYVPDQFDAVGNPTVYKYVGSTVEESVQKTTVWNGSYAMDYNENQELDTVNKDVYIAGDIMQSDDTSGQVIAAEFEGPANTDDAVNVSFKKYYEQLRLDDSFFNQTQLSTQTGMDVGADITYVNTVPKDFPYANVLAKQDLGRALDNSLMFDADSQYYRVKDVDASLLATNGAVKFEGALRDTDNAELLADGVSYPTYEYGINLDFSNATKVADQAFTLSDGIARNLNVTTATLGIVSGKSPVVEKNSGLIIADETPLVAESISASYEQYMFDTYGLTITSADADFNKTGSKYYVPLVSSVYAQPETTYTTMYTLNDVGLSDSTWTQENTFRFSDYLIGSGKDDSVFSAQRETVLDKNVTFNPDVIVTKSDAKTLSASDNTYVSGVKSISGYNLLDKFYSIFRK